MLSVCAIVVRQGAEPTKVCTFPLSRTEGTPRLHRVVQSVMLPQAQPVGRSAGSMTVDVVRAGVTPSRATGLPEMGPAGELIARHALRFGEARAKPSLVPRRVRVPAHRWATPLDLRARARACCSRSPSPRACQCPCISWVRSPTPRSAPWPEPS